MIWLTAEQKKSLVIFWITKSAKYLRANNEDSDQAAQMLR